MNQQLKVVKIMDKMKKLIEVTDNWLTLGIFHYLNTLNVPWTNKNIDSELDTDYYGNNSGDKFISPLVVKLLGTNEKLTSGNMLSLANVIYSKFGEKWSKLYATLSFEYNPIENYNMVETHEGSDTHTHTPENWVETTTQTPTDWKTTSEGLKADNESESSNSYYGFGDDDGHPTTDVVTSVKNKQTTETSGTYQTETTKEGTETDTIEYDTTLQRSGNIGTMTTQMMIESERKLWDYNIFKTIYEDVDSILTLSIY